MPLQTSRYLMTFSLVIVLICGFTLLDQLAGITKQGEAVAQVPRRSVRTTRSLQPTPPREPVFVESTGGYDYPEYETQSQVPVHTASFANDFNDSQQHQPTEFGDRAVETQQEFQPGTDALDWPSDAMEPPAVPSGPAFDAVQDPVDSSVPGFAPTNNAFEAFENDEFDSVEPVSAEDFADPSATGPGFPEAQPVSDESDADLGAATTEPWDSAEPKPNRAMPVASATAVAPVIVSEPTEFKSRVAPEAPRLLSTEASRGEAVRILGFTTSVMKESVEKGKGRIVMGSYRIRSAPMETRERRIRGQFRFEAPVVEPLPRPQGKPIQQTAVGCRHCRASGQAVCPKCGAIRAK